MRHLISVFIIIVTLPTFITLHGFRGAAIRVNLNTIQSYEDNIIDAEEQKTLLNFTDGNSQTVIETTEQIDTIIKELYPQ